MKKVNISGFLLIMLFSMASCKKDLLQTVKQEPQISTVTLSAPTLVLTSATANSEVQTISWAASDYGYKAAINYEVELAAAGTNFADPLKVNMGIGRSIKYIGSALNDIAIGMGIAPGTSGTLDVRVKSSLSDAVYDYSSPVTMNITTYVVEFPALLVRGGNGWSTPATRTNGFVLTSPDFNTKYEGYIYLPNADGWGGDAFKLLSTSTGTEYGWGSSSTTIAAGASGNLWLEPAPNYMKVNVDVNALTINYVPVQFNVTGDHNGWSTTATPMTYDPVTRKLIATNVTFAAGNSFGFTANGSWDLNYKLGTNGKLVYGGPPDWAGDNIPAPGAGTYTVILDLSGGNGYYTYTIQ